MTRWRRVSFLASAARDERLGWMADFWETEGLVGVAIVSGVALVAGVMGSILWKGLARKR